MTTIRELIAALHEAADGYIGYRQEVMAVDLGNGYVRLDTYTGQPIATVRVLGSE